MFRRGDRVKILNTDDTCDDSYCVGLTGTIANITREDNSDRRVYVKFDENILPCRSDDDFCWYYVRSLELIKENLRNV